MTIRPETKTRCEFASRKYYEIVRKFAITNFSIKENKIKSDEFKFLSGIQTHTMHVDLLRCYNIYIHYRNEYMTTLSIINGLEKQ